MTGFDGAGEMMGFTNNHPGSWCTVQFFLNNTTGAVDEVQWHDLDGEFRCTCGKDPCLHVMVMKVRSAMVGGGMPPLQMEAAGVQEAEDNGLDISDPEVLRDLLRRHGSVELTG